jgi:hypothetical protein
MTRVMGKVRGPDSFLSNVAGYCRFHGRADSSRDKPGLGMKRVIGNARDIGLTRVMGEKLKGQIVPLARKPSGPLLQLLF